MRKGLREEQWDTVWNHWDEYHCTISDHGTARVYERGETKVARLCNYDPAYLEWVMALWDGELESKHYVKVYSIHFEEAEQLASLVVLERLEELVDMGYDGIDDFFGSFWRESLYGLRYEMEESMSRRELALITPEFMDAYEYLLDEGNNRGWSNDIHGYNIMVRTHPRRDPKTGRFQVTEELVIIDPWC